MPRAGRGILPEGSAEQTAPVKRYMVEPILDWWWRMYDLQRR